MSKIRLFPHQEKTVGYGVANHYAIFALSPGTGKTYSALETWNRVGRPRLLLVVPAYLSINWQSEIKKFFGEDPDKPIVTAFKTGKSLYYPVDSDICIVSYDLLKRANFLFKWAKMVVADEAHLLMNMTSKRSDTFHRGIFENSMSRLLLLTGTPIKNRVEEFYSLIALCNYNPNLGHSIFLNKFPDSISFADHFSHRVEFDIFRANKMVRIVKWEGIKNEGELGQYLKNVFIRFTGEQVLKDLPEVVYKDVYVGDTLKDDKELMDAFNAFNSENKSVAPNIKADAAYAKVPFTIKYVSDLLNEVDQVVVYTDHQRSASELAHRLGFPAITGSTSMQKRNEIAEKFIKGESKALIATIGSFSTGVNLTNAHHMVFNDYSWVPGDMDQAIHRISRIGQKQTCFVHRILGSHQDKYIIDTIENKKVTIKRGMESAEKEPSCSRN